MDLNFNLTYTNTEFLSQVYIPVIIWLLAILALFIILLYKFTFGNWTPENPNPYAGETFGMPRGVFRGILTMTLLFVVVLFEVVNLKTGGLEDRIEELLIAFQMIIAFYFGSKVMHHLSATDKRKTKMITEQVAAQSEGMTQKQDEFHDPDAAG